MENTNNMKEKVKYEIEYRIRILRLFGLDDEVVSGFDEGKLFYGYMRDSEAGIKVQDNMQIDNNPKIKKIFDKVREDGFEPYYGIYDNESEYFENVCVLVVSTSEENLPYLKEERELFIYSNIAFCYVYNFTEGFGEYGSVYFGCDHGALRVK